MTVRPCPGLPNLPCGILVPASARRCEPHRLIAERSPMHRSSAWYRLSSRMLREHRRTVGPWCPGAVDLDHDAHVSWDLTVDHVIPITRGGAEFDRSNLRILCRSANSSAARRPPPGGHHRGSTPPQDRRPAIREKQ